MKNICCFAGHSRSFMVGDVSKKLNDTVEMLITKRNVDEFWVGNYGFFDELAAGAVRNAKRKYSKISLNLVVPYLTQKLNNASGRYKESYDNIFLANIPENTPRRFAISKCNEYMVKNSGFLICYVAFVGGGSARTLEFARKCGDIEIFNLA